MNVLTFDFEEWYYSPSEEEVQWAEEMVSLYEEAQLQGKGVAVKGNKFIGPPMMKMAKDILYKASMCNRKAR